MSTRIPSKTRADGGSSALNLLIHLNSTIFHPPPPHKKLTPKFPPIKKKKNQQKKTSSIIQGTLISSSRCLRFCLEPELELELELEVDPPPMAPLLAPAGPAGPVYRHGLLGHSGPAWRWRQPFPKLPKRLQVRDVFWLQNVTTFFGTSPKKSVQCLRGSQTYKMSVWQKVTRSYISAASK